MALVLGVEGGDGADFGARDPQDVGDEGNAIGADVAVLGLDEVEHREQRRPGVPARVAADDLGRIGSQSSLDFLGVTHRSTPPKTGSIAAKETTTSASWPPSVIMASA